MKYSQGLSSACWKLSLLLAKWAATPRFPPLAGPPLPLWTLILSGSITGRGCCDTLVNSLQELRLVECLRRGGYGWTVPLPLLLLLLLSLAGPGACCCCVLALALLLPDEPRLLQDACLFSTESGKIGTGIVWIVALFMALENTSMLDISVSLFQLSNNYLQPNEGMWLTEIACAYDCHKWAWLTASLIYDLWIYKRTIHNPWNLVLYISPNLQPQPSYSTSTSEYIPGEGEFDLLEVESGSPLPE